MSRFYIPAFIFLLLVIEGTLFQIITPSHHDIDVTIVPRFLVVMVVFIGIHFGRNSSILYGIAFGLIYDIVYTQLLGVYMFGFGVIGYAFAYSYKQIQDSLLLHLVLVAAALSLFEYYQYGLYRLIGITDMGALMFFHERFWPSMLLNMVFAIIIYYPVKRLFSHVERQASLRER
ncbi:rod shape-determining protein MreD [Alkalihalobacillus sp. MEB130]|uniref:rod shape-determining protein MreD n=1 Tax=Alkalihalobacillus sp. MEB130 TaxID=2976704 RepID=UPI0028DE4FD5|nr:rod shape-determining protein MreD [Alkalihalobacillus sp. MEB130]MDT8859525.1 rod shape-determining protein MreD [Alkalihalobacillus sp. MEB130]